MQVGNKTGWLKPVQVLITVGSLSFLSHTQAQTSPDVRVAGIYGAQSHVIDLNDQRYDTLELGFPVRRSFPMVADRDMLFKVNLIEPEGFSEGGVSERTRVDNLKVSVTLDLDGVQTKLTLDPPSDMTLPTSFDTDRASIIHTFDNSYTTTIPKKLMKPGLRWKVGWCHSPPAFVHCKIGELSPILVRPPIKMTINVFPFEFFGWNWRRQRVNVDAMLAEMAQRLPVSELIIRKPETDYYKLDEILIPASLGYPPRIIKDRIVNRKLVWDTENRDFTTWNHALYQAAGLDYNQYTSSHMLLGTSKKGAKGKGSPTSYMTVSVMPRPANYGIAWHESLHMYGLDHWGQKSGTTGADRYPYIGPYLGIDPPDLEENQGHRGPSWGYDARKKILLPPTIMQSNGFPRWRRNPEKSGNEDGHWHLGMKMTPLSDWSAVQVMRKMGNRPAWFDAEKDSYWVDQSGWHRYDWEQKKYVLVNVSDRDKGWRRPGPTWSGGRMYSMVMQASTATKFLTKIGGSKIMDIEPIAKVYPPIGPYTTNMQNRIHPEKEWSRRLALQSGICDEVKSFCDFSIRVKRKGQWKVYVLDRSMDWDPQTQAWDEGSFSNKSFITVAINLPVREGEIEEAEFLLTPNALQNPWVPNPKVLASWKK